MSLHKFVEFPDKGSFNAIPNWKELNNAIIRGEGIDELLSSIDMHILFNERSCLENLLLKLKLLFSNKCKAVVFDPESCFQQHKAIGPRIYLSNSNKCKAVVFDPKSSFQHKTIDTRNYDLSNEKIYLNFNEILFCYVVLKIFPDSVTTNEGISFLDKFTYDDFNKKICELISEKNLNQFLERSYSRHFSKQNSEEKQKKIGEEIFEFFKTLAPFKNKYIRLPPAFFKLIIIKSKSITYTNVCEILEKEGFIIPSYYKKQLMAFCKVNKYLQGEEETLDLSNSELGYFEILKILEALEGRKRPTKIVDLRNNKKSAINIFANIFTVQVFENIECLLISDDLSYFEKGELKEEKKRNDFFENSGFTAFTAHIFKNILEFRFKEIDLKFSKEQGDIEEETGDEIEIPESISYEEELLNIKHKNILRNIIKFFPNLALTIGMSYNEKPFGTFSILSFLGWYDELRDFNSSHCFYKVRGLESSDETAINFFSDVSYWAHRGCKIEITGFWIDQIKKYYKENTISTLKDIYLKDKTSLLYFFIKEKFEFTKERIEDNQKKEMYTVEDHLYDFMFEALFSLKLFSVLNDYIKHYNELPKLMFCKYGMHYPEPNEYLSNELKKLLIEINAGNHDAEILFNNILSFDDESLECHGVSKSFFEKEMKKVLFSKEETEGEGEVKVEVEKQSLLSSKEKQDEQENERKCETQENEKKCETQEKRKRKRYGP